MIDIADVAARLDAEERLKLTYKLPVRSADGSVDFEIREADLLDVSEESSLFYVRSDGEVIWVKLEEVVEVVSGGG